MVAKLSRITDALRDRGVRRTAQSVLDVALDTSFDRRFRVDTGRTIPLGQLNVDSRNWDPTGRYQPIRVNHMRRLLARVPEPDRTSFVDFGAGKGRALIIASLCGFTRVVGVEISRELCCARGAKHTRVRDPQGPSFPLEVVHQDAALYEIEADQNVFFFYSPFAEGVLQVVVDNILASLRQTARQVWILYSNPKARKVIDQKAAFRESFTETWGGTESVAFVNAATG